MRPGIAPSLALALVVLVGCGKKPSETPAPASNSSGTAAVPPAASSLTDQADCAGAYAAVGGIDPGSVQQDTTSPAFARYARMLAASIDATTSATAADAGAVVVARAGHWKSRPAAEQAARAAACQSKYGF